MSENKAVEKAKPTFKDVLINTWQSEISAALPGKMDSGRFIRTVLSELRRNPKLLKCNQPSVFGAIFSVAQLGLEFIDGQAYLVPFWNNSLKSFECVLIIGYKGIKELYYRHPSAGSVEFREVCQNDIFDYEHGTSAFLRHKKAKVRGPVTDYYCQVKLINGFELFEVMTKEECIAHGLKHSKTVKDGKFKSSSPWVTDVDSMCKKTVFRMLSKEIPQSSIFHQIAEADESIRKMLPGQNVRDFTDIPNEAWSIEENEKTEFPQPPTETKEEPKKRRGRPPQNKKDTLFDDSTDEPPPPQEKIDELVDRVNKELDMHADKFWAKLKITDTKQINSWLQLDGIEAALEEELKRK